MSTLSTIPNEQQIQLYQHLLHHGKAVVVFRKANGDERVMTCTLNPTLLPLVEPHTQETPATPMVKTRTPNPGVCAVYDLEKHAWRSFRWDSVISFTAEIGQDTFSDANL